MSEADPPRRRASFAAIPGVVWACCLVLLGLFAVYGFTPEATRTWALATFAFVPARMAIALDLAHGSLQASVQRLPQETFTALIGTGGGRWWTLATYPLVDASWPHVCLNAGLLAVFGAPVARRLGSVRFLALLLAATLVGALVQFACNAASFVPVVGASAAVSAAIGAAARFVFAPGSGAGALFDSSHPADAPLRPPLALTEAFANRATRAFILYGLFNALYPLSGATGQPPAWPAAAAAFLVGILAFPHLDARRRAPRWPGPRSEALEPGRAREHRDATRSERSPP